MTTIKLIEPSFVITIRSSLLITASPFLFGMSGQGRGVLTAAMIILVLAGLTLALRGRQQVRKVIDDLPDIEIKLAEEMKKDFTKSKCPGCGETTYSFLQFNTQFTALQLECKECSEVIWLESRNQDGSDLEKVFLRYKELISHVRIAQPEDDIITNWQCQIEQENINE